MFSSNFQWSAEAQVEKVGERRARKQPSISSGLRHMSSDSATISSRSSSTGPQPSFYSSVEPNGQSAMRDQQPFLDYQRDDVFVTKKKSLPTVQDVYPSSPSFSSQRRISDHSRSISRWSGKTSRRVKATFSNGQSNSIINQEPQTELLDEVHQIQQLGSESFITRSVVRHAEYQICHTDLPNRANTSDIQHGRRTIITATPSLHNSTTTSITPQSNRFVTEQDQAWRPPSCWNVVLTQENDPTSPDSLSERSSDSITRPGDTTHLQQFIERMEETRPKIVADRIREGYDINGDSLSVETSQLKYQLWILAALKLGTTSRPISALSNSSPSKSRLSRLSTISSTSAEQDHVMVLFGSLADVYQVGIMNAHKQVTASSTFPTPQLALPPNVSYQLMSSPTYLPLPYPSSIFTHVHSPALAPSLSAPKIPSILLEMHRLLCEDGVIDIRLTDAIPKHAGLKLRTWLDDHIMLSLERGFRCARPTQLMPEWLVDAGFEIQTDEPAPTLSKPSSRILTLPVVSRTRAADNVTTIDMKDREDGNEGDSAPAVSDIVVDERETLAVLAGRALWKDVWGGFAQKQRCDWWDEPEIEQECREMSTTIEIRTIRAVKKTHDRS